ncbi:SpoIIE family protein phosphatase [Mycolicibacterium wolinskyi]|uniref:Histidine kinase n=1 Tax=Mycolicibacterium wolinskyi TaxID=59750 RepID=A0A1X2FH65_9MYCO|nr:MULTISPECIES: SpoIIE family protein phosphatase [Mycolicibacterium]MCV7284656.1 SpoIIE family protein phosphatase [Mycolicibacterium wolinskyi]MCV7295218.1 SpoIIE family protein phosphatase [Mycolicibacterium goodii]ORX17776.1 histidine kinase [Mycolicibacterium wolinskyi]
MTNPEDLVPPGTTIDLDNCAREPIHIPGSIQPRGVLAVVRESDFEVRQVSANVDDLLARPVDAVLGRHLSALMGADQAARVEGVVSAFRDLRQRNPVECVIDVGGESREFDVILHREPNGMLLVELEIAYGERPYSYPNTYQAVRSSVEELNRADTLFELYDASARAVRDLTGFDRVMVYRYDDSYNGEVVAESKRDDLNPFLGLHYPSTDIPAQARALYEKNWLRLISDVNYTPAKLVPAVDPVIGAPTDLTYSTLRSVSPIHIEYLQNMGVHASMSISLLRHGRLWGLIACHHYSGPHLPPFGARAAAEFLGSTLSLRLVDQFEEDQLNKRLDTQAVLAKLMAATIDDRAPIAAALLGGPDLLDLVPADGVVVNIQGERQVLGTVPPPAVVSAVIDWARGAGDEVASSECLSDSLPDIELDPQVAAGALVLDLPDGQHAVWFRREVLRSVDWGGDPHNKAIAISEGLDGREVRLSPRKSFDRWREIVRRRSQPWTAIESEAAEALRRHLVESLYSRTRGELRMAETLQRSLLPQSIPTPDNWQLSAHYEPAAGGRVGGDWYDAFELRDGRLIVLIGDVAGHGITAAGTMAQLRNALRAYLFAGSTPAEALNHLNDFSLNMVSRAFATVLAARVDLSTGHVDAACAGHLMPYLVDSGSAAVPAPLRLSPPIGVRGVDYAPSTFTVEQGTGLVMFSDGLVERRGQAIDDRLDRLAAVLAGAGDVTASWISEAMESADADDDVTVVTLRRRSVPSI